MLGHKTGIVLILAGISPLVAAVTGWIWGAINGGGAGACDCQSCAGCGYDLTGNVSGVCPECGLKIIVTHDQTVEIHTPIPRQRTQSPAMASIIEEMNGQSSECITSTIPTSLDDGKQQIVQR